MNKLFAIVILASVLCCVNTKKIEFNENIKALLQLAHNACLKITNADESQLEKFNTQGVTSDNKAKCFIKCMAQQFTFLDDEGNFDTAPLTVFFPKDYTDKVIPKVQKCIDKNSKITDLCEKSYQIMSCGYKIDPDNFKAY